LGESEEATPLGRKWAIPAAISAGVIVVVSLYFGSGYVLLSQDSIRGVLIVCMTLIGCAMVAEFTMRSRHRVVVGFVGGLCLFSLFGFYVLSFNPKFTTLSYWLGVGATIVFFLVFALYALREPRPVVPSEAPTRPVEVLENFEAGILNEKRSYCQEENIQLWAKYTGKLEEGYHVIQVSSVSGATIPEGRDWWSDSTTYHNPNGSGRVGRLIVPPPYEYKASQPLSGFPIGEYKIVFEIGQGKLSEGKRLARAEAFFVVELSEIEVKTGDSEQTGLRKKEIWNAFQKWTQLPIVRFRDQQDTLPLAEKPPELAFEIDECLKGNYPAIWDGVRKLRQQYHAWKNEDVPHRFTKVENGRTIIDLRYVYAYNESMCNKLVALHRQLADQIRVEILDKHHTRLKC
jgi:hypothetical protein